MNNTFRAIETHNINESGDGEDVASDPTGAHFITLSGGTTALRTYDTTTFALTNSGTTNLGISGTLDVAINGDIYVTGWTGTFMQHDPTFAERGMRTFNSGYVVSEGRVSGDGKRSVIVTSGTSGVAYVLLNFFDSQLPP